MPKYKIIILTKMPYHHLQKIIFSLIRSIRILVCLYQILIQNPLTFNTCRVDIIVDLNSGHDKSSIFECKIGVACGHRQGRTYLSINFLTKVCKSTQGGKSKILFNQIIWAYLKVMQLYCFSVPFFKMLNISWSGHE